MMHRNMNRHQWTPTLISYIWKRDKGLCVYCGSTAHVIDHVVPFSYGGQTRKENGVCCCNRCNRKKAARFNQDMLTRGIFWLLSVGEDMDWTDSIELFHKSNNSRVRLK